MNKIKFYLDFGGFYNSPMDSHIDNTLSSEIEYYLDDLNQKKDLEIINYKELCKKISKEYISILNEALFFETELDEEPSLEYMALNSPRFYNFETDTILTSISIKDLRNLLRLVDRKKLIKYIDENSKSRSGFISCYDGFPAVKKDLSIFASYLFNYLFEVYQINQSTLLNTGYFSESVSNLTLDHITEV